jgi:hypothetical protein
MNFEAFWIPGLNTEMDPDEALAIGYKWLDETDFAGKKAIVLNAASMLGNRPMLARATGRYRIVSPRTKNRPYGSGNAILAVWPTFDTLAFAEGLAHNGGVCLIPNSLDDMSVWVSRTQAVNLTDPEGGPAPPLSLDASVVETLDSLLSFDGHNGFYGAGGKDYAVRGLRAMVNSGHRPSPDEVEGYAVASGETNHKGAGHLRELYEGVLSGRRFRDYGGRLI